MDSRPVLLDASFLIAIERETTGKIIGPARSFLQKLRGRRIVLSVVTVAEVLEGAKNNREAARFLTHFTIQPLGLAHARRCALLQARRARRLGENDAWMVATAELLDADIVGCDRAAFQDLGSRYLQFT